MIYDILEEKIRASILLVPGESLFRNYMPPEVTIGAMVRVPLDGIPVDHYMPNYYRGKMQVITRHINPVDGDFMANSISKLLRVEYPESYIASVERGAAIISIFLPLTLPIRFPSLAGNGFEWSQTFTCTFSFDPL